MLSHDTIFTNVAVTADNEPWWEGRPTGTPVLDWRGREYHKGNGPAAHPNSRFTVSARQNAAYSPSADEPAGVPISAIVFGGRRRAVAPLVYEARSWAHGVLVGASVASETTAAATGQVGVVRRDPMAMKPFCGYNFADYWRHWLDFGARMERPPRIFHVNWFRQDARGRFLWPGFGENLRVLRWMLERCEDRAEAVETPIGYVPAPGGIDETGLTLAPDAMRTLLAVDRAEWTKELEEIGGYLASFGERLPRALVDEQRRVAAALRST
jgi:phosphoenolpyruvate carboxykinase (GTP)